MSFNVFQSGFCKTVDEFKERLRSYQLYNYAAQNWGYHACKAWPLCQEVTNFLECEGMVEASSQALLAPMYSGYSNYSQEVPRQITGLHLAAYFGVCEAVSILLQHGQSPDLKNSRGQTPLWFAALNGQEPLVKLLLSTSKVDADSKDDNGQTPLLLAAMNGHEAVVKLLLATSKVDADSKDKFGRTPLQLAARNGYEAVVKLLRATLQA
jgi:ankyrin repeat protein